MYKSVRVFPEQLRSLSGESNKEVAKPGESDTRVFSVQQIYGDTIL